MKKRPCLNAFTLYLFIIFSFLISCETIETGKEEGIKIGERYNVNPFLSFKVDSLRDYRCPIDVLCIWGGDVDLYFKVFTPTSETDTMIRLYDSRRNPIYYKGYKWQALDVTPYPDTRVSHNQEDYLIKFIITREGEEIQE